MDLKRGFMKIFLLIMLMFWFLSILKSDAYVLDSYYIDNYYKDAGTNTWECDDYCYLEDQDDLIYRQIVSEDIRHLQEMEDEPFSELEIYY